MKTHVYISLSSLLFFTLLISCTKKEPVSINEEEVIDRVVVELTNSNTNAKTTHTWNEGDTSLAISLVKGERYTASVYFYNATDPSDIEDITEEVREEADEHFVFYEIASDNQLAITTASNDTKDSSGNPIGLQTQWEAKERGTTLVRLYLIHEPSSKSGSSRNDFGGETDAQIDLNITVE